MLAASTDKISSIAIVVVLYVVALLVAPLALIVVFLALLTRRINQRYSRWPQMPAALALPAGMAISVVVLPICLLWYRLRGKSPPPPPKYGRRG